MGVKALTVDSVFLRFFCLVGFGFVLFSSSSAVLSSGCIQVLWRCCFSLTDLRDWQEIFQ